MNDFDKARRNANLELTEILIDYFIAHPYMRFGQALLGLGIVRMAERQSSDDPMYWVDEFYLEPQELLKRVTYTRLSLTPTTST